MAIGIGLLGLAPEAFWKMTLREFEAAASVVQGQSLKYGPPTKVELTRLMTRFPDT